MFNLLVTSAKDAWNNKFYQYDKSRFLEYTNESIAFALESLSQSNIENLKSFPCLFAYEGEEDMRIGYLTSIKENGRSILIEFELQHDIEPIPYKKIESIAPLLDIRSWEMNRTHWAVKDEDLLQRLIDYNIIVEKTELKLNKLEKPTPEKSEKTNNPTISTVRGFIDKVLSLSSDVDNTVFYRGHSNKRKYKLEPSLFRRDEQG